MNSPDKIVLCHNKPEDYKDIFKFLEENNFTVFTATDREKSIELFLLEKPDLIILDMDYPDRWDIISQAGKEGLQSPVILMSDREEHIEEHIIEGLKIGAEDYIIKPVNMPLLLHKIKKSLEQKNLKEKNKVLLEKDEAYRTLIENINYVIFSVDMEGNITYISSVIENISKYKVHDFMGRPFSNFIHPDDLPGLMDRYRLIFKYDIKPYEYRLIDKDGGIIHIRSHSRPVYKNGIAAGLTGIFTDITEKKKTEKTIRETEEKLRLRLASILAPDYEIEEEELKNIIEAPEIQLLMNNFYKLTYIGMAILDLKGNILVATGWQDICTKFHRIHPETLANCIESDCYLSQNVKKGQYLAYKCKNNMWDIVTPVIIGNKHVGNLFLGQFLYDDEKPDYEFFAGQAERYSFDRDKYLAALDSVPRWSRDRVNTVMNFYVKLIEIISNFSYSNLKLAKEILERKRTEEEIRQFSHTLNSSLNEIYIFDKETLLFKFVSAGALKNLGYTIEEVKSLTPLDLKPEIDIKSFKKLISPLLSGEKEKIIFETKHRRSDGSLYPVEVYLQIYEEKKEYLAFILDITERKKLEEQLLHARKIESVGRLAGGIAHDFNNILAIILGHGEIMEEEMQADSPFRQEVDIIIRAAKRARDLTRQLLAFARKQTLEMKPVNLNRIITDFEKILRRTIRENITIEITLSPSLKIIKGDEGQIEQIILNLALNAQDAMPKGGTILIETGETLLDEEYEKTHEGVIPGNYAMMVISDTGEGMAGETLEKIFEPFFSTKEMGRGTGLGLSTVYGIVKQHMGHINVYSETGKGSNFKVYFPVLEQQNTYVKETEGQGKSYRGNETVLVVEDEENVRGLACAILKKYGYKVFEASGGETALQLAGEYRETIDLLITDVIMGDTNGKELYEKLSSQRQGLKVLYMSGYTENLIGHHGILYEGINFIQKPFSLKDFVCKVRKALD